MSAIRNIATVFLFALMLSLPTLTIACPQSIKSQFPGWLASDDAKYLTGSLDRASTERSLNIESFSSGQVQNNLEVMIENKAPARYCALLINASTQRAFIFLSNCLFGWDCYPTFFGSTTAYHPSSNQLFTFAQYESNDISCEIARFGSQLSKFASSLPDKRFIVIMPDNQTSSAVNPTGKYLSNFQKSSAFVDRLLASLNACDNVTISARTFDSLSEYSKLFYKTDAHWNGYGAALYFQDALPEIPLPPPNAALDKQIFNGQCARSGLQLLHVDVTEPLIATNSLVEVNDNSAYLLKDNGAQQLLETGLAGEFNFYGMWYGGDYETEIHNQEMERLETVLIIGDSYSDALRWIAAQQFSCTIGYMDLHSSSRGDNYRLSDRIASSDADTIILVASPLDYSTLLERHPDYLNPSYAPD